MKIVMNRGFCDASRPFCATCSAAFFRKPMGTDPRFYVVETRKTLSGETISTLIRVATLGIVGSCLETWGLNRISVSFVVSSVGVR